MSSHQLLHCFMITCLMPIAKQDHSKFSRQTFKINVCMRSFVSVGRHTECVCARVCVYKSEYERASSSVSAGCHALREVSGEREGDASTGNTSPAASPPPSNPHRLAWNCQHTLPICVDVCHGGIHSVAYTSGFTTRQGKGKRPRGKRLQQQP